MGDAVTLEYAKGVPRWRRWKRRGMVLAILLGCTLAAWVWRRDISRHVAAWWWQRECLAYDAPPTEVVYDELDGAEILLRSRPGDYFENAMFFSGNGRPVAAFRKNVLLENMIASSSGWWPYPQVTVFMHERVSRRAGALGGNPRLVAVTLAAPSRNRPHFDQRVWELGSPLHFPQPRFQQMDPGVYFDHALLYYCLKVRSGQVDPADTSHFTFEFELREPLGNAVQQSDVVDGWLEADDSVTLAPRHEIAVPGWP